MPLLLKASSIAQQSCLSLPVSQSLVLLYVQKVLVGTHISSQELYDATVSVSSRKSVVAMSKTLWSVQLKQACSSALSSLVHFLTVVVTGLIVFSFCLQVRRRRMRQKEEKSLEEAKTGKKFREGEKGKTWL